MLTQWTSTTTVAIAQRLSRVALMKQRTTTMQMQKWTTVDVPTTSPSMLRSAEEVPLKYA